MLPERHQHVPWVRPISQDFVLADIARLHAAQKGADGAKLLPVAGP